MNINLTMGFMKNAVYDNSLFSELVEFLYNQLQDSSNNWQIKFDTKNHPKIMKNIQNTNKIQA